MTTNISKIALFFPYNVRIPTQSSHRSPLTILQHLQNPSPLKCRGTIKTYFSFYHDFACCSFLCLYTWLEWDLYENKNHALFIAKYFLSGAMPRTLHSTFY